MRSWIFATGAPRPIKLPDFARSSAIVQSTIDDRAGNSQQLLGLAKPKSPWSNGESSSPHTTSFGEAPGPVAKVGGRLSHSGRARTRVLGLLRSRSALSGRPTSPGKSDRTGVVLPSVTVIRHSLSPSQNAPSRSLNASPVAVTAWARASSELGNSTPSVSG